MRKKRGQSSGEDASDESLVNLTPLIDVVFVVLIMFIIVAPMLELDRISLAQAAPHSSKESAVVQQGNGLTIHVRADNTIWINKRMIQIDQLSALLRECKQREPHLIPQLFHDRKAYFETYQTIKNAVEMAGYEELDVILQPG